MINGILHLKPLSLFDPVQKEGILFMEIFDCAILGAGPAGITASLVLGRARRKIALFDNGTNRNRITQHTHGFLTRDGASPTEFKNKALNDLKNYPSVHLFSKTVTEVRKQANADLFQILTFDGKMFLTEKILLATGVQEVHPSVPNLKSYYGKSIFSCPYCDGWELRDQPLIIIIENIEKAFNMAKVVYNWSKDLVVATNGYNMPPSKKAELEKRSIQVVIEPICQLHGTDGYLKKVEFASGFEIERVGGFIKPSFYRANYFAEQLHCDIQENGIIVTDKTGRTSQKNVYAAGETVHAGGESLTLAAAQGNKVAFAINTDWINERF